ncbi:MAG: cobalamin B12-binding domain-containing protein [Pseudomonadota bacterium]
MIYPYFIEERIHAEDVKAVPIGLYSVAAVLKERGYDVEVLNWHDADKRPDEIEKTLMDERPDVIGFSILHANRWGGIEIARTARRLHAVKRSYSGLWEKIKECILQKCPSFCRRP